jgi:hypothetical protein
MQPDSASWELQTALESYLPPGHWQLMRSAHPLLNVPSCDPQWLSAQEMHAVLTSGACDAQATPDPPLLPLLPEHANAAALIKVMTASQARFIGLSFRASGSPLGASSIWERPMMPSHDALERGPMSRR